MTEIGSGEITTTSIEAEDPNVLAFSQDLGDEDPDLLVGEEVEPEHSLDVTTFVAVEEDDEDE